MTLDPLDSLTDADLQELAAIEDGFGPENGIFAAGALVGGIHSVTLEIETHSLPRWHPQVVIDGPKFREASDRPNPTPQSDDK